MRDANLAELSEGKRSLNCGQRVIYFQSGVEKSSEEALSAWNPD